MELTTKQLEGLEIAIERYKRGEKYTVIGGYAGTGKSTLVKFIVKALNIEECDIVYTAFTGKACQVLQKKGNKNVSTLHKLLYTSYPRPDGTFVRLPVDGIPYKIVIVDEVSMAPMELMSLLFKYTGIYVICLGDPFQLPPVDKNADNHLLDNPHVFLTEIMRQAAESEIIQLSMAVREGKPLTPFKGKEVQVLTKEELNTGMLMWADQILCGTNATRVAINNQMRELLGRNGGPQDGDKVICLRNYWDRSSNELNPLVNGTIGTLHNSYESFARIPPWMGFSEEKRRIDVICGDFVSDTDEIYTDMYMDKKLILTGEKTLDFKESYKLSMNRKTAGLVPMEFTYGYAITTHKSQGSEWDKVLVIEERFPFDKEEHARWLYTAITRAAEKLVLIKA